MRGVSSYRRNLSYFLENRRKKNQKRNFYILLPRLDSAEKKSLSNSKKNSFARLSPRTVSAVNQSAKKFNFSDKKRKSEEQEKVSPSMERRLNVSR